VETLNSTEELPSRRDIDKMGNKQAIVFIGSLFIVGFVNGISELVSPFVFLGLLILMLVAVFYAANFLSMQIAYAYSRGIHDGVVVWHESVFGERPPLGKPRMVRRLWMVRGIAVSRIEDDA
jgi:hypothetical protein